MYYDINTEQKITRQELEKEFVELVENGDIEYDKSQFESYLENCTGKNGQLIEL